MGRTKTIPDKNVIIASAKALRDAEYSYREIAKKLNISPQTAYTYVKMTDENLTQLANAIKKHWQIRDFKIAELAADKIQEKIDLFKPYDLTGLYKISRELQFNNRQGNTGNNVQININTNEQKGIVEVEEIGIEAV